MPEPSLGRTAELAMVASGGTPAVVDTVRPGPSGPFRSVLLAVEAKEPGPPASDAAWGLLRFLGVPVTVCHVVLRPTSSPGNDTDGAPANPQEVEVVQRIRAAADAALGSVGRNVPIRILHGDPGQRICEFAAFLGCDLIVLGPRSKSTFAKALKGSVTKYVVGHSPASVLVLGG